MRRDLSGCIKRQVLFGIAAKRTDQHIVFLSQSELLPLFRQGASCGLRQPESQRGITGIQMQGTQYLEMVQRLMLDAVTMVRGHPCEEK